MSMEDEELLEAVFALLISETSDFSDCANHSVGSVIHDFAARHGTGTDFLLGLRQTCQTT
jgi:hypothetical protein